MISKEAIQEKFRERDYQFCLNHLPDGTTDSDLLRIKALCYQKSERWEDALDVWNALILRNDQISEFFMERGVCKFHLGFKSTLEDFDEAVNLEPDNPYRLACRGFIKDKLGNTVGAIEDYKLSLELEPDNEVTLNNLGLLEEKLGYAGLAKDRYKQADTLAAISKELNISFTEEDQITQEPEKPTSIWKELRRMFSSRTEFVKFLREARDLFFKKA
ncbi:MAG: hypothetical protein GC181_09935 [Bacteroidetes bacterium]|nr:hypothetical protein [Bacteroidota bacterium]